ncbi:unnamed protein product [Ascophyllum nodosum]
MFRAPVSHALRASRRAATARAENASRAIVAASWISDGRASDSSRDAGISSALVLAVALAATGAVAHCSSPPRAEASNVEGGVAATGDTGHASPPTGLPGANNTTGKCGKFWWNAAHPVLDIAAATSEVDSMIVRTNAERGSNEDGTPDDGEASEGADEEDVAAPDDDGKGNEKLGLRLSAIFVRQALKEFREKQATARVLCPPVDFRQEKEGGRGATMSASFYLPRAANMLRVIGAMVPTDELMEVKQSLVDKSGASIAFCHKDGQGSLLLRQDPTPGPTGLKDSIHLYRDGGFTRRDLEILVQGYQEAWSGAGGQDVSYRFVVAPGENPPIVPGQPQAAPGGTSRSGGVSSKVAGEEKLRQLGVEVYDKSTGEAPGWDSLAGYVDVKQEIEDTLVMPLRHPEVFDVIARKTRTRFESNRPRAVLFEGPPGTGKTLSARIIAGRSDRPMVHVPVEGIMSKWYGESEKKLSAIFDACEEMGGAIIFIDEVDAMAGSRAKCNMHEATRRILSVILQKVEGFEKASKNTLICATNRKDDLDSALLSRFQLTIRFGLPDTSTRREVFAVYAKQLAREELETLASISGGMSCRDIKETCQHAERRWASKLVRGQETAEVPSLHEYVACLDRRSQEGAWSSRPAQA